MKLSNQALGAIMMCLQKAILKQTDVTMQLKNLDFYLNQEEALEVNNPPTFEVSDDFINSEKDNKVTAGSD